MSPEPLIRPQTGSAIRRPAPRAYARARVLCFPHAGGTAGYYRRWAVEAPWNVEFAVVQYPGREDRYHEPAHTDMVELSGRITDDILAGRQDAAPLPTVLFGHSMGAAVAWEVARGLTAAGREPAALVVSGRPAPALSRPGTVHLGSDDELVADMRRLGGTSSGILDDESLMAAVLPTIRRDYQLIETYRPLPGVPLRCPVTVLYGDQDPEIDEPEAEAWDEATEGPCRLHVLPGDHFYLEEHRREVLGLVVAEGRRAAAATAEARTSMP